MRWKEPLHVLARGIDFQEEVRFCPFYKLLHPAQVGLLVAEVWFCLDQGHLNAAGDGLTPRLPDQYPLMTLMAVRDPPTTRRSQARLENVE